MCVSVSEPLGEDDVPAPATPIFLLVAHATESRVPEEEPVRKTIKDS